MLLKRRRPGFSLTELMIVVAIIAIVAAIAVPKLSALIRRANEGSTLGKLGAIRSALSIYYADNEALYPSDLSPLLTPGSKYLTGIIPMYTMSHGSSDQITYYSSSTFSDTGGWGYINVSAEAEWGRVWVDCTHTDQRGGSWTSY